MHRSWRRGFSMRAARWPCWQASPRLRVRCWAGWPARWWVWSGWRLASSRRMEPSTQHASSTRATRSPPPGRRAGRSRRRPSGPHVRQGQRPVHDDQRQPDGADPGGSDDVATLLSSRGCLSPTAGVSRPPGGGRSPRVVRSGGNPSVVGGSAGQPQGGLSPRLGGDARQACGGGEPLQPGR